MVDQFFPFLISFYRRLVLYFDYVLVSIGGAKYIIAALVIVFFVSLILIPLRGRGIDTAPFSDMVLSSISKPRYRGKYESTSRGRYERKGKSISQKGYSGKY